MGNGNNTFLYTLIVAILLLFLLFSTRNCSNGVERGNPNINNLQRLIDALERTNDDKNLIIELLKQDSVKNTQKIKELKERNSMLEKRVADMMLRLQNDSIKAFLRKIDGHVNNLTIIEARANKYFYENEASELANTRTNKILAKYPKIDSDIRQYLFIVNKYRKVDSIEQAEELQEFGYQLSKKIRREIALLR